GGRRRWTLPPSWPRCTANRRPPALRRQLPTPCRRGTNEPARRACGANGGGNVDADTLIEHTEGRSGGGRRVEGRGGGGAGTGRGMRQNACPGHAAAVRGLRVGLHAATALAAALHAPLPAAGVLGA